jgi:hypothetical protein
MTNGPMYFRPMPGRILDSRNLLTLSGDDCGVSRRSSPAAHARAPGPYADTYVAAVNSVVVESDGSRPDRPDYLRGGGQARRHRAACNRGHGLLRCCVELTWRWLRSDQPKHYRARSWSAQIVSITHLEHDTSPTRRAMVGLPTRGAISRPRARLCWQGAPGTVCPAKMES